MVRSYPIFLVGCGGTAVPGASPAEATYSMLFKLTNSPNNLQSPGGIAVDTAGNVYVTDDANPFVRKFDNDGNFLSKWGGKGSEEGQFKHATGITADQEGHIYVAEYEGRRVQKKAVSQ